jgi:hypothetical protein
MDKCEKISENARKFILPFFDEEQEKHITRNLLEKYYNHVHLNL